MGGGGRKQGKKPGRAVSDWGDSLLNAGSNQEVSSGARGRSRGEAEIRNLKGLEGRIKRLGKTIRASGTNKMCVRIWQKSREERKNTRTGLLIKCGLPVLRKVLGGQTANPSGGESTKPGKKEKREKKEESG